MYQNLMFLSCIIILLCMYTVESSNSENECIKDDNSELTGLLQAKQGILLNYITGSAAYKLHNKLSRPWH